MNSSIDYKGLDFELIPLGARIAYSVVAIKLVLVNMVQKFEWKLPNGKDLDMNEASGAVAHKAVPLLAVASQSE